MKVERDSTLTWGLLQRTFEATKRRYASTCSRRAADVEIHLSTNVGATRTQETRQPPRPVFSLSRDPAIISPRPFFLSRGRFCARFRRASLSAKLQPTSLPRNPEQRPLRNKRLAYSGDTTSLQRRPVVYEMSTRSDRPGDKFSLHRKALKSGALWFPLLSVEFSRCHGHFSFYFDSKTWGEASHTRVRGRISRIEIPRVVYPRCIHLATCHVAATVTPPHLLIVAMDTSASFPRSFPTYARESANSRKFWQFRSPATRRGPRMRHFRFNPACIRASQREKKTGKTLASTRTRFFRKTFSSSTSPLLRQRRTHLRNAARDRNFRSTRSKWTSDTKCDRLPRPPRRDWDATGACACSARLPLGRASHGSRSVSVAPAARIVARTSLSLSLFRGLKSVPLARYATAHRFSSSPVPRQTSLRILISASF